MKFQNKTIALIIITSILIGELIYIPQPAANAAITVFETNPVLVGTQTAAQTATAATTAADLAEKIARWVKEDLMKALRDVVAKRIIDYMVDQTITWIQGGGKPQFVSDWNGFLQTAGNIAFDQVVKDIGLAWICSPFKLQVQLSLIRPGPFSQQLNCTLDRVVANIENF